jgi:hypothetical protein
MSSSSRVPASLTACCGTVTFSISFVDKVEYSHFIPAEGPRIQFVCLVQVVYVPSNHMCVRNN